MSFSKVLGQEQAVDVFKQIVSQHRLAHAYILAGPAGVGKFILAKELAKYLLCEKETGCGRCRACLQVDHLTHPSLSIIETTLKEKYIPIERIRAMEQAISLKPFMGQYKIFIINDADLLSEPASNALLKTLEEPPSYSLLLLVTARPEALLPTVYSRCQVIRFRSIKPAILIKFFKDKFALSQAQAQVLAGLSDGSLGQGCYFMEKGMLDQREALIERLLRPKPADRNVLVDEVINYARRNSRDNTEIRTKLIQQFKVISLFLRDLLLMAEGIEDKRLLFNQDKEPVLKRWAGQFSPQVLGKALGSLLTGESYIRANANINLAVTQTIMSLLPAGGN